MIHSSRFHCYSLTICLLGSLCLFLGGCAAFGTVGYLIKGDEIDPPCKNILKGKVAIVCRPGPSTSYQNGDFANELARALQTRIQQGLKKRQKVELIPRREIEDYCDGMEASMQFDEIGAAVGADQVIAVDLRYNTHIGGINIWRGHAIVEVSLIDVATGDILYDAHDMNEFTYPANAAISASEKSEHAFLREYLVELADYISRAFVPYSRFDHVKPISAG
ncbi:MAG: hypothetical protein Q4C96_10820 [Planctomycetia bacterium]|nr:hypothetical protein [Planctomycetia bacterium]